MIDINTAQSAWFIARPDDLPAVGFDLFPIWVDVMSAWLDTNC